MVTLFIIHGDTGTVTPECRVNNQPVRTLQRAKRPAGYACAIMTSCQYIVDSQFTH